MMRDIEHRRRPAVHPPTTPLIPFAKVFGLLIYRCCWSITVCFVAKLRHQQHSATSPDLDYIVAISWFFWRLCTTFMLFSGFRIFLFKISCSVYFPKLLSVLPNGLRTFVKNQILITCARTGLVYKSAHLRTIPVFLLRHLPPSSCKFLASWQKP